MLFCCRDFTWLSISMGSSATFPLSTIFFIKENNLLIQHRSDQTNILQHFWHLKPREVKLFNIYLKARIKEVPKTTTSHESILTIHHITFITQLCDFLPEILYTGLSHVIKYFYIVVLVLFLRPQQLLKVLLPPLGTDTLNYQRFACWTSHFPQYPN